MISLEQKINNLHDINTITSDNIQSKEQNIHQNDLISIQKLKSSVLDYQTETNQLTKEVEQLKETNINLVTEVQNLNSIINSYKKKEILYRLNQENLEKLKDENESLKSLLLSERNKYLSELRLKDNKYNQDVIQTKTRNESLKYQNEMFTNVKKLNDILYIKNNELKKNIDDLKKEKKEKITKIEVNFHKKFDSYKNKMLNFLKKNEQQRIRQGSQIELNNRLNVIHIQELINELEIQGIEVEDLLKERQDLKLKIIQLNDDLLIYQKVIDIMTKKNQNFQKKLKLISNNINEYNILSTSTSNSKNDKDQQISTAPNDKSVKIMSLKKYDKDRNLSTNDKNILKLIESEQGSNSSSKKTMKTSNNDNKKLLFMSKNKYSYDSSDFGYTTPNLTKGSDFNKSQNNKNKDKKTYDEIYKEKEKYKELYESLKEKYDFIKKQYSNIFNMYNNALEKIYNEDIVKTKKENIFINLNDFKEFKFEKMSSEQKYAILIKLINNIAPIVYKNDIENNLFAQNVSKVKEKYNFKPINIISPKNFSNQKSPNNYSTSPGMFNMKIISSNINDSFRNKSSVFKGGMKSNKSLNSFEDFKKIIEKKKAKREKALLRFGKSKIDIDLVPNTNLFFD